MTLTYKFSNMPSYPNLMPTDEFSTPPRCLLATLTCENQLSRRDEVQDLWLLFSGHPLVSDKYQALFEIQSRWLLYPRYIYLGVKHKCTTEGALLSLLAQLAFNN